jgi:hypothetical protein
VIACWKGIIKEINFGGSIKSSSIIENLDLEKPSFRPSKWPLKLKPAKNSKLPKLPENSFEPVEKGGWPSISNWITDYGELECYEEAMQVDTKKKWEQGMKEEMDSLANNQTWDLVQLPTGKRALQNKWVYKLKEEDGGEKRYKARLVVKGFAQKKGIDFDEIFSPVVKMTSIRTILSLVAVEDLHVEQLDVKTTFLHGDLEEEIYMQ